MASDPIGQAGQLSRSSSRLSAAAGYDRLTPLLKIRSFKGNTNRREAPPESASNQNAKGPQREPCQTTKLRAFRRPSHGLGAVVPSYKTLRKPKRSQFFLA